MGVIGERKLQELIDQAAWEVANGTPQDIASRGLFEACAEAIDLKEDYEEKLKAFEQDEKEWENEKGELERRAEQSEEAEQTLARERDDLRDRLGRAEDEREDLEELVKSLTEKLGVAEARTAELERQLGDAPAMKARAEYLEQGIKRFIVEAYKLRKGVL